MNASYDWLKAFLPLDLTPEELREKLTAHTATVEELVPMRTDLAAIVIARVEEVGRHPDSDHLWLTKVNAGGELLEVVCGAPVVKQGALYPFAPLGTTMPSGIKIERRKIRGIFSNGMLCSARELGLGEDHAGILELELDAKPGTPFLSAMPVGDTRLVVDVGANRPDLLSHLGLARELSAITGRQWELPVVPDLPAQTAPGKRSQSSGSTAGVEIRVDADTHTRRYMAAVVRGVKIGPSPDWLVRRLGTVGVRSINNVVDATNYVLHELGQPVHAFDLQKLASPVVVRMAKPSEKLTTLDGVARALPAKSVVIADARGAQAIAGVMGGRESEVTESTADLLIEVASFDPKLTHAARKAIGLATDASHRFERGVDPELGPLALDRTVRLILALAGGKLEDVPADVASAIPAPPELSVRMSRVEQVLGEAVPLDRCRQYLEGAGFTLVSETDSWLTVRVPTYRGDVTAEIDLVEEIARFHGYDNFPDEIRPFRPTSTVDDPLWVTSDRLRSALVGLGLYETRPMPFVHANDEVHVRVANPLAENEAYLRTSILETLAKRAEFNLSHRVGDVRLFEIGSVFTGTNAAMPRERLAVGAVIMGHRRPAHFTEPQPPAIDEWDAKALAEVAAAIAHPGEHIELLPPSGEGEGEGENVLWRVAAGEKAIGTVRRLTLDAPVWASPAFGVEIDLGEIATAPPAERGRHSYKEAGGEDRVTSVKTYRPLPTMPAAEFDLALLVPSGTTVADVERVIRASAGELLEQLVLFDQYTGAGVDGDHRSLAWRLTFRHPERTLRDKEIEGRRGKILGALQQELHVRQRTA